MSLNKKKVLIVGHIGSGPILSACEILKQKDIHYTVVSPKEAEELKLPKPEPYIFNERPIEPIINKRHDSHLRMKSGKELRRERRLIERNKHKKK